MTQARLNRAVARATGEDLSTIEHMGFSVVDPDQVEHDPGPALPQVVDWDALDADRVVLFPVCQQRLAA
ncbi:MAG TPA: hypothetical protein VHC22_01995 [Pirellulales bacterium]|nr:hypothetical protein [Pirellulales bacterium]